MSDTIDFTYVMDHDEVERLYLKIMGEDADPDEYFSDKAETVYRTIAGVIHEWSQSSMSIIGGE